jgi:hypothetical protein
MGVGGVVALQSLLTIKDGTSPFNYQPTKPFSKFLRQQMAILKFLSDAFLKNATCVCACVCGGGLFAFWSLWLLNRAL